jgi:hypothetical protein
MYYFKKKTDNPVEFTNVTGKVNEGVEWLWCSGTFRRRTNRTWILVIAQMTSGL